MITPLKFARRGVAINSYRGPVPDMRPRVLPATGLTSARPERLVKMLAGDVRDRLVARYVEAKEAEVNAATVAEDVIAVPVRIISATYVPGHCMDHRDPAHLKAAVSLMEGIPAYDMHWAWPEQWLGMVLEADWDATPMGAEKVPGISGIVALEPSLRSHSDRSRVICRGVEARSLKRWSLGFLADFEPSHPEVMDKWSWDEYWLLLGTQAPDGTLFRFIVNAIPDVYEFSVVDVGAIESAITTDAPDNRTARNRIAAREASKPRIPQLHRIKPAKG